jgi:ATP-dependent helicase/nuclease subunit A
MVLDILNNKNFSFLFGENSKAEVSIFGKIEDNIISGQIDRISIIDNIVYIIDYKTTNFLPDTISQKYIKQLELYKKLLEKIYKGKTIKCYILWTSFAKIEEIKV